MLRVDFERPLEGGRRLVEQSHPLVDPPERELRRGRLGIRVTGRLGVLARGIELDDATWQRLFTDVGPEDLANKGKPFPIGPYFDAILEAYERQVTN